MRRILLPNVLSETMVEECRIHLEEGMHRGGPWDVYPIDHLVEVIRERVPIKLGRKSYWNLECMSKGHDWHYDGCELDFEPNHMAWCQWSAVTLLSPPDEFEGGEFQFWDDDDEDSNAPQSLREELYRSLLIYPSGADNDPLLHQATPHTNGERWMLLMFFEGED